MTDSPEQRPPMRHAGKIVGGGVVAAIITAGQLSGAIPNIVNATLTLLRPFEGGRAHDGTAVAYVDHAGRGSPVTYCGGLTGGGVRAGARFTRAECDHLEAQRVEMTTTQVFACVPRLPINTAAATTSLAYNIGLVNFCHSSIARHFRAGEWRQGCDGFLAWSRGTVRGRRVVLRGLVRRREAERALCLEGLS